MGANFVTLKYHSDDKEEIARQFRKDQEQDRYENGHSYSGGIGMANGLVFNSYEAPNEQEAEFWLDAHCVKWGNAVAIHIQGTHTWMVGAVCSS